MPRKKPDATVSDSLIDAWFARHFHHVTPGTPDHAVLTAALADLKDTLTSQEPAPDEPAAA